MVFGESSQTLHTKLQGFCMPKPKTGTRQHVHNKAYAAHRQTSLIAEVTLFRLRAYIRFMSKHCMANPLCFRTICYVCSAAEVHGSAQAIRRSLKVLVCRSSFRKNIAHDLFHIWK